MGTKRAMALKMITQNYMCKLTKGQFELIFLAHFNQKQAAKRAL